MSVPCALKAGQATIRGLAIGGIESCYQVQPYGLLFDVGHCPRSLAVTPRLFITHAHADHAAGLVGLLSLRLVYGAPEPLQVYAPEWMVEPLKDVVAAFERMQPKPYSVEWHPMTAGSEVALPGGRLVRAFRSPHVVPTMGYTVWESVSKLKPELVGIAGPELAALRRAGHTIQDTTQRPVFSFPGDTTIGVLDKQPHLLETRCLLLESTYLDDKKTAQQCLDHGHVHLDQVLERAADFKNEHLVLTHFSQAYRPDEAKMIVSKRTAGRFTAEVLAFAPEGKSWPG